MKITKVTINYKFRNVIINYRFVLIPDVHICKKTFAKLITKDSLFCVKLNEFTYINMDFGLKILFLVYERCIKR